MVYFSSPKPVVVALGRLCAVFFRSEADEHQGGGAIPVLEFRLSEKPSV